MKTPSAYVRNATGVWRKMLQNCRTVNSAALPECSEMVSPNAVQVGAAPADGWYLIAPYGEFARPDPTTGTQVFHRTEAEAVVRTFNSMVGKAGRYFKNMWHGLGSTASLPVFEGHADSDPQRWRTMNRLAEIDGLLAGDGGLYGRVTWNASALAARTQELGPLKPSPLFWHEPPDDQGHVFPEVLESVGLVTAPNIRTAPTWTANATLAGNPQAENQNQNNMNHRDKLIALLGLKADATDSAIQSSLDAHGLKVTQTANALTTAEAARSDLEIKLTTANAAKLTLETAFSTANGQVTTLTKERDDLRTQNGALTTERDALVTGILDVAEKRGVIAPADRDAFKGRLTTANTAAAALTELRDKKPALNTNRVEIGNNRVDLTTANARQRAFNAEVQKRMKDNGGDYDAAFASVLDDPAFAQLTEAMKQAKLEEVA